MGERLVTRRQRVDGNKFQEEFEKAVSKVIGKEAIRRLHTPGAGRSGLTQPADFIVFNNYATYIETKETTRNSLSISALEQLDEIKKFIGIQKPFMKYYIVVHFISFGTIKVITASEALELLENKKQLIYNMEIGNDFEGLKDFTQRGIELI